MKKQQFVNIVLFLISLALPSCFEICGPVFQNRNKMLVVKYLQCIFLGNERSMLIKNMIHLDRSNTKNEEGNTVILKFIQNIFKLLFSCIAAGHSSFHFLLPMHPSLQL